MNMVAKIDQSLYRDTIKNLSNLVSTIQDIIKLIKSYLKIKIILLKIIIKIVMAGHGNG